MSKKDEQHWYLGFRNSDSGDIPRHVNSSSIDSFSFPSDDLINALALHRKKID